MSRDEVIDRGRQELAKRVDAILSWLGYDFSPKVDGSKSPGRGRFFFTPDSSERLLALSRGRLRRQTDLIIRDAERIVVTHRFDLLGFENLCFGEPIDWHLDPVHGKRAPSKPFYKVPYLSFAKCGDSKIIWELNRHQHLVTLAKAYRLTQDRRYADECLTQWKHWQAENPYPIGINWASSLEVAFRSLSWLWMYHLLEGSPILPSDFRQVWLRAQALNGRHIMRYLSTHFSANTHLLGEAVALFFLGVLCPELPQAGIWKVRGWKIVLQESRRQVQPDGFHFEQSVYYHVYALDFFIHALVLARLNAVDIPQEFQRTIEKMLEALLLLGGSGSVTRLGDDDGGRVFDPRRNRTEHLLDPLATGAVLFNRADFKGLAGELTEETLWLMGEQGIAAWERPQNQPRWECSASLPKAGLYLLTTTNPPSELCIDAGKQGAQNAGHAHADALSICLQSKGRPLLIDPGTFQYVGAQRDKFRGTAMHSTLRVDGADQAEPAGPFAWRGLAHAKVERWIQGESFDWFIGSHDGYARLDPSIMHRRWVLSLRCGLFLVRDEVEGIGKHRLDVSWHLAPDLQACGNSVFRLEGGQTGLSILAAQDSNCSGGIVEDCYSPVYGQKQPAIVMNFGGTVDLPNEFSAIILPLPQPQGLPNSFRRMEPEDVASKTRAYWLLGNDMCGQFVFGYDGKPWRCGALASDAQFVCWYRAGGDATLILCDGSYLNIAGTQIVSCTRAISHSESSVRGGAVRMVCSEPAGMDGVRDMIRVRDALLSGTVEEKN